MGPGPNAGGRDAEPSGPPVGVEFGMVLRRLRVGARLTQEELAGRAGMSARSVSQLERGRVRYPRSESVRLLGRALGLAGAELVRFEVLARSGYWADREHRSGEPVGFAGGRGESEAWDAAAGRWRGAAQESGSWPVPAQLPADVVGFVGRHAELAELDRVLAGDGGAGGSGERGGFAVAVPAESGIAGVGCSALAIRWAHRVLDEFPDGQLYVDLGPADPTRSDGVGDVLGGFLAALGVPGSEIPAEAADRADRFRLEIAERRVLIVVDNACSADQVRPLLPGGGAVSRAVVTSRDYLSGLDEFELGRVELGALSDSDAVALLQQVVGDEVGADPDAAAAVAAECGRLPAALRVVAGTIAAAGGSVGIAEVVAELTAAGQRGDRALSGDSAALAWCYRRLPTDAATALRLLAAHPGPDLDAPAAAALLGVDTAQARRRLESLAGVGVVSRTRVDRFAVSRLVAADADAPVLATEDSDRQAALARLFGYYLSGATAALQTLAPGRSPAVADPRPASIATDPARLAAEPDAALAWLAAEVLALAATAAEAGTQGPADFLVGLGAALAGYLDAEAAALTAASGSLGEVHRSAGGLVRVLVGAVGRAAAVSQQGLLDAVAGYRHDRDQARQQSTRWRVIGGRIAAAEERAAAAANTSAGVARRWDGNPYQGLWPFTEHHAEVFYGREQLTAALVGKLAERLDAPAVVVVTGASGAGKSSLLRAGLLPALARGLLGVPGSAHWPTVRLTPTGRPLEELAAHLAPLAGLPAVVVVQALVDHPDRAHLLVRQALRSRASVAASRSRRPGEVDHGRLVVVVDQFEQVFTAADRPEHGSAFVSALLAAATTPCGPGGQPPAVVVLGVRGDYWDRCAADPALAGVLQDGQFVVGPMTEPELRRVITGPAAAAGLDLEAGLTDTILADLRGRAPAGYDTGALPLLSQALHLTYTNREDQRLTLRGYGTSGGAAQSVAVSAETVRRR